MIKKQASLIISVVLTLVVTCACALFPFFWSNWQDQGYLGKLDRDTSQVMSYSYAGSLENKVEMLDKWLSASPEIQAKDVEGVDNSSAVIEEMERNMLIRAPSEPLSVRSVVLSHRSYPSSVQIIIYENEEATIYVDEKSGKVLRFTGGFPDWTTTENNVFLSSILPHLADAYSRYLGLGENSSLDAVVDSTASAGFMEMRFSTDKNMRISILAAPTLDMLYVKLESEGS